MLPNKFYSNFRTVGITGHRDLIDDEIPTLKAEIKKTLLELKNSSDKELILVSPLAEGADQIFIEAGLELNLRYKVLLPMPKNLYLKDFDTFQKKSKFNSLLFGADDFEVVQLVENNSFENISEYGKNRDLQYLEVGKEIALKSDNLITLWDGIDNQKIGGTANIINIRKELKLPFIHIKCRRKSA
jgi:hypothetical protein